MQTNTHNTPNPPPTPKKKSFKFCFFFKNTFVSPAKPIRSLPISHWSPNKTQIACKHRHIKHCTGHQLQLKIPDIRTGSRTALPTSHPIGQKVSSPSPNNRRGRGRQPSFCCTKQKQRSSTLPFWLTLPQHSSAREKPPLMAIAKQTYIIREANVTLKEREE